MDADFMPFPNFIYRTLGFFRDPAVAIVQTPQEFYNAEPRRKNLGLAPYLPDEQDFFYRVIQPGPDVWDAAFYCGSAAMIRRQAILEIGGFVTATAVEDQATAVKLLSKGYKTRYLNEPLSVGLATESNTVLRPTEPLVPGQFANPLSEVRTPWARVAVAPPPTLLAEPLGDELPVAPHRCVVSDVLSLVRLEPISHGLGRRRHAPD
jgi:hypothetical protein